MPTHINNPVLSDMLPKSEWRGTPLHENGTFINHEFPFLHKFREVIQWKSKKNPFAQAKKDDVKAVEVKDAGPFLRSKEDGILWLGHACFFIRLDSINILVDPVWHPLPLVPQFIPSRNYIDQIDSLDYLLISHDHRDHCDQKTIEQLCKKFAKLQVKSGLKMDSLLKPWIRDGNEIECAGWYQKFNISHQNLSMYFLPTRHWSKRSLWDANKRLWGAFVIEYNDYFIYFGGDTGYGNHFQTLEQLFPKLDVAIMGIGAYEPRWFMHSNHISPEDAAVAFIETKARHMIPMHYGMFDLSDEPQSQPLQLLFEHAGILGIQDSIIPLVVGERTEIMLDVLNK